MTVQGELLNALREHDLPPFWDGLAVVWGDWQPPWPDAFVCPPPPPSCCPACGCLDAQVTNRGRVATSIVITHEQIRERDAARVRLPERVHLMASRAGKLEPLALARLHVTRCPACRHDQVWDMDTGAWWNLDHTDYGPAGSTG